MSIGLVISVFFLATVLIYFLVINPSIEEKNRAAKEVGDIVLLFGNDRPTLVRFDGKDERGLQMFVFVLLSSDDCLDPSFYTCDGYYELGRVRARSKSGKMTSRDYKRVDKYIDSVLSAMPYHVPRCFSAVSWDYYSHRRMVYREARYLDRELKNNACVCFSVESDTRPGRLAYVVWGPGQPFKYGTNYYIISYDEYLFAPGDEEPFIVEVLRASSIKDRTIHVTKQTWDDAFAHYADGVKRFI